MRVVEPVEEEKGSSASSQNGDASPRTRTKVFGDCSTALSGTDRFLVSFYVCFGGPTVLLHLVTKRMLDCK